MASANPEKHVIWAVAASAFFGFFRLGGLLPASLSSYNPVTSLSWGDVSVDSHTDLQMIQFHIKVSKCDQFGSGTNVVVGKTGIPLCLVAAIARYFEHRGDQLGAFFLDSARKVMTKPRFVTQIRDIVCTIGLPQHHFAGHSFRIGAATSAAAVGIGDSAIQMLGRWHSAAFLQYIRTPKQRLAALSTTLATATNSC